MTGTKSIKTNLNLEVVIGYEDKIKTWQSINIVRTKIIDLSARPHHLDKGKHHAYCFPGLALEKVVVNRQK